MKEVLLKKTYQFEFTKFYDFFYFCFVNFLLQQGACHHCPYQNLHKISSKFHQNEYQTFFSRLLQNMLYTKLILFLFVNPSYISLLLYNNNL